MNEAMQLMAGFKDIKHEFRTKLRIAKSAEELALWFTFENGILYVHDYEEHKTCMALAIKSSAPYSGWRILLKLGSSGESLVKNAINLNGQDVASRLNESYNSVGFIPFNLKK